MGVSLKLGEIGEQLLKRRQLSGKPAKYGPQTGDEVERHYSWALEELLRNLPQIRQARSNPALDEASKVPSGTVPNDESGLTLPRWADGVDLVNVLETVAGYYSRRPGRQE